MTMRKPKDGRKSILRIYRTSRSSVREKKVTMPQIDVWAVRLCRNNGRWKKSGSGRGCEQES